MVLQGLILALLSSVFFGGNHAAARRGLVKGDVYAGVLLTLSLGLPGFFALAWSTGELSQLPGLPSLALGYFMLAGILHFVVGRTLTYASLQQIGTTRTSPIVGTNTLYTVVLAIVFLGEPASLKVITAALLVVAGVILLSRQDHANGNGSVSVKSYGVAYSLVAGFIFGVTPLLVRAGLLLAPLPALSATISYAVALSLYSLGLLSPSRRKTTSRGTITYPFLLAAISVNLGQILRYYALNLAPASVASTIINAFPLFALIFAYPGRRGLETYSRSVLGGASLILIGVNLIYLAP